MDGQIFSQNSKVLDRNRDRGKRGVEFERERTSCHSSTYHIYDEFMERVGTDKVELFEFLTESSYFTYSTVGLVLAIPPTETFHGGFSGKNTKSLVFQALI